MNKTKQEQILAAAFGGVVMYLILSIQKKAPIRTPKTDFKALEKSYLDGYEDAKKDYGIKN